MQDYQLQMTSKVLCHNNNVQWKIVMCPKKIKDHVCSYPECVKKLFSIHDFILKKYHTEYEAKFLEALVIEKQNPKLNFQLYANGSLFLLNIY